ncbi:hypothetical protein J6590_078906 [Homalodisca vitripennis]|nr:hypothetical protein J6590_078906 [Homalodisca vitripennis]
MGFGSEMNGCGQFVKYGMFVSNFVIFVGGITVFVIGIWTLIDKSFINELLGTNLFMGAVYILIATGALVTLVSFFGCLGAIKEIKCMLLTYFIMVLIILVVMLVGGILGYVFREKVRYSMEQEMYSSIKSYNEKKSLRRAWDDTQENLHCCGVTSFTDWRGVIPDSCCRDLAGKAATTANDKDVAINISEKLSKQSSLELLIHNLSHSLNTLFTNHWLSRTLSFAKAPDILKLMIPSMDVITTWRITTELYTERKLHSYYRFGLCKLQNIKSLLFTSCQFCY